jgi:phosphatidate cytidylyltransferase
MLKQRLLTAIILIPLFLFVLIKFPPGWFCILTGIIVVYAGWEWSQLAGITVFLQRLIFPLLIFLFLPMSLYIPISVVLWAAFIYWLIAAVAVMFYPRFSYLWGTGPYLRMIMGFFVLIPCWRALNFMRSSEHGVPTLLFLFVLIWGADSAAYFVGKKWGKTKLLPNVSPGKSWQGLVGALGAAILLALFVSWYGAVPKQAWFVGIVLSLFTVLFSVLGDLFESMLKRQVGVKDSGCLLPGHGGVLDRIDSLTAAAPIFAGVILFSLRYTKPPHPPFGHLLPQGEKGLTPLTLSPKRLKTYIRPQT